MKKLFYFFILTFVLVSCSTFQKALKSEDAEVKYTEATKLFDAKKYSKALRLFEQLSTTYKGKPQAEKMFYMYSMSFYNEKEYYAAGYQFEKFVASYPKSEKVEEAAFLGAKCFSKLSPVYSLDQVDTDKAIEKTQNFIDTYPNSTYSAEANTIIIELRGKLEKKSFEIAKQYNQIADYKSALVALENFIGDFPGTPYKEEALFYKLDSSYKLAINSISTKMQERLNNSKVAYDNLLKFNANSKFKNKADDMLVKIEKDLKQFSK